MSEGEADNLVKIWSKKRLKPKQLTFGEVSTHVELSEKICNYRYRLKLEKTRQRMAQHRKKKKAAAKQEDLSAKNDSSSN